MNREEIAGYEPGAFTIMLRAHLVDGRGIEPRSADFQSAAFPSKLTVQVVLVKRLELIRFSQQILSLPRLPFRHTSIWYRRWESNPQ